MWQHARIKLVNTFGCEWGGGCEHGCWPAVKKNGPPPAQPGPTPAPCTAGSSAAPRQRVYKMGGGQIEQSTFSSTTIITDPLDGTSHLLLRHRGMAAWPCMPGLSVWHEQGAGAEGFWQHCSSSPPHPSRMLQAMRMGGTGRRGHAVRASLLGPLEYSFDHLCWGCPLSKIASKWPPTHSPWDDNSAVGQFVSKSMGMTM